MDRSIDLIDSECNH